MSMRKDDDLTTCGLSLRRGTNRKRPRCDAPTHRILRWPDCDVAVSLCLEHKDRLLITPNMIVEDQP